MRDLFKIPRSRFRLLVYVAAGAYVAILLAFILGFAREKPATAITVHVSQWKDYNPSMLSGNPDIVLVEMPAVGDKDKALEGEIISNLVSPKSKVTTRSEAAVEIQLLTDRTSLIPTDFAFPRAWKNFTIGLSLCDRPFIDIKGFRRFYCSYTWLEMRLSDRGVCPTFGEEISSILANQAPLSARGQDPQNALFYWTETVCAESARGGSN